ncbi:hypothetical protein E4U21_000582 [Claviceps maximensis]|nr:hypothetical protein E4U21_000582 [Claviceps maximensis]
MQFSTFATIIASMIAIATPIAGKACCTQHCDECLNSSECEAAEDCVKEGLYAFCCDYEFIPPPQRHGSRGGRGGHGGHGGHGSADEDAE